MNKQFKLDEFGIEAEIGKVARQADGAIWIKAGNNIVLATAVASKKPREFMGFFPLFVEYRERMSAAGKIPGGYIKREGRLSDFEVLSCRLIDRPLRPLFPQFYFNEVQILSTVFSSDGKFPTDILGLIGASLALVVSKIPFLEPVGAVRAGRVKGAWKFNLSHEEMEKSDAAITIAGTKGGIAMVEGHCNNIAEDELLDVLFSAHDIIKKQVEWQEGIARELNVEKVHPEPLLDWEAWKKKVHETLPADFTSRFYTKTKKERSKEVDDLRDGLASHFAREIKEKEISGAELNFLFDLIVKEVLPDVVAKRKQRIDGRAFDEIRPITVETGILPRTHGSALFTRGETQALVSVTLGTAAGAQKIEPLIGAPIEKSFMLHYNFPPFSTGEVKMIRGVGRRELGHGYLAESSFYKVLPERETFPYTIRAISDILESNGSSSMASVAGTTMALMDAGVPIKDLVSGVAMGLMKDSSGNYHILSDILGTEDAFGLMDFKITGTQQGVMAVQMDIKEKAGLPREVLKHALEQARNGRLHILKIMSDVMSKPRPEVSELAPRITTLKVSPDKIGMIIGPGGKNIKEIIALTGAEIDIEDDGTVNIYAVDSQAAEKAMSYVKILSGDVEIGSVFVSKVRRHVDYGMFVDIFPGVGGLIHISTIDREKQPGLESNYPLGSDLTVKITGYDRETGRIRLVAPEIEGKGGERPPRRDFGGDRRGGDRRGGGGDRRGGDRRRR